MIACMRSDQAVFNNYGANEQLAWSMRANESNALPILGLYTHRPPQLQGQRIDESWSVHLYSDTVYCFRSIIYSLKHIINRNNEAQNRPKWTGGGDRLQRLGTHIFLTKLVVPSLLKAEIFHANVIADR